MRPLDDGTYSVVVVDAVEVEGEDALHVELAITQGPAKGDVIRVRASSIGAFSRSAVELLGLPGTLTVRDGAPHVTLEG